MHCLTTKLISNLTEKNKTHSMVQSYFFKLKKKKKVSQLSLQQTMFQYFPPTGHKCKTRSRNAISPIEIILSLQSHRLQVSLVHPRNYSSDSAVGHRSRSELCWPQNCPVQGSLHSGMTLTPPPPSTSNCAFHGVGRQACKPELSILKSITQSSRSGNLKMSTFS